MSSELLRRKLLSSEPDLGKYLSLVNVLRPCIPQDLSNNGLQLFVNCHHLWNRGLPTWPDQSVTQLPEYTSDIGIVKIDVCAAYVGT
jgi:hypothetical protein